MTYGKKIKRQPKRLEGVVELLTDLEHEAEGLVRRVVEKAEETSRELRQNGEKILDRAKEFELGGLNRDQLIREAKRNFGELAGLIQSSAIYSRALDTAKQTKDQVLSVLSIPTQDEVVKLSRKIATLEQRVNRLTRKAA